MDYAWLGGVIEKRYAGDDSDVKDSDQDEVGLVGGVLRIDTTTAAGR